MENNLSFPFKSSMQKRMLCEYSWILHHWDLHKVISDVPTTKCDGLWKSFDWPGTIWSIPQGAPSIPGPLLLLQWHWVFLVMFDLSSFFVSASLPSPFLSSYPRVCSFPQQFNTVSCLYAYSPQNISSLFSHRLQSHIYGYPGYFPFDILSSFIISLTKAAAAAQDP